MKSQEIMNWQYEEALRRYLMITPLLDLSIDNAQKQAKREEIAIENNVSTRTLYRYEADFRAGGFIALKPRDRIVTLSKKLPENYLELIEEAKQLKREQPKRSVEQIIYILEGEGRVEPGVLKRSTLQRRLFEAGFGKQQMKKYIEGEKSSSTRRYCKPHRMMLVQADIKYGVGIIIHKNGKTETAYLSTVIDDHSRHILASEWYISQDEYAVTDVVRKSILRAGKYDVLYTDNGTQYISKQLRRSLALLDIRILHAPVRAGWAKGVVEKFHQVADDFIAEVKLKKIDNLEDINRYWNSFVEEYYEHRPHAGIREYYESRGIEVPKEGISPLQEWNRDSRSLVFIDTKVVAEAFLYHETRRVDKGGCISFKGKKYQCSAALIGAKVNVTYNPLDFSQLTVTYKDMEPMTVKPVQIGPFVSPKNELPAALQEKQPETSRFLDVVEAKHKERQAKLADAISYGGLLEENKENK